jgi:hypothetical protein
VELDFVGRREEVWGTVKNFLGSFEKKACEGFRK